MTALLEGAQKALTSAGVKPENIVVQSVPGSYELPYAVQRMYAASQVEAASTAAGNLLSSAADLLGSSSQTDLTQAAQKQQTASKKPFDAVIAIGVLIKGETMHFEYISDAVSHALMKTQMEMQVPVIFGLLTLLKEEQGLARAGLQEKSGHAGHNHGEDWGKAAVELGVKRRGWTEGKYVE